MKLIDMFIENFPMCGYKTALKQKLMHSVEPCLFYGRLIDCQCTSGKYTLRNCYQSRIEQCWLQEATPHFDAATTEMLLNKFNKTY